MQGLLEDTLTHFSDNIEDSVEQNLRKHEEHYLLDIDKVVKWRRAMREAANLSGWELRKTAYR
jgi:hypothetical protein